MRYSESTNPTSPTKRNAKALRETQTLPEAILWKQLRGRRLGGFKFRRQYPIGRFMADFYCHEVQLIIELDGPSHENQVDYDVARTCWFEANSLHVIRFSNQQLNQNLEGVCRMILAECERLRNLYR